MRGADMTPSASSARYAIPATGLHDGVMAAYLATVARINLRYRAMLAAGQPIPPGVRMPPVKRATHD